MKANANVLMFAIAANAGHDGEEGEMKKITDTERLNWMMEAYWGEKNRKKIDAEIRRDRKEKRAKS